VVELEVVDDYYFSSAFALMIYWPWKIKGICEGISDFRILERRIF
jgi:hypothetical protein